MDILYGAQMTINLHNKKYKSQNKLKNKFKYLKKTTLSIQDWQNKHNIINKIKNYLFNTSISKLNNYYDKSVDYVNQDKINSLKMDKYIRQFNNINYNLSPLSKTQINGVMMNYVQYYKQKYQIDIQDYEQPLIKAKSKIDKKITKKQNKIVYYYSEIYLIPQLVSIIGVPENIDQNSLQKLKLTPNQCLQNYSQFIQSFNTSQEDIQIDSQNLRTQAHLLDNPVIQLNKSTKVSAKNGLFQLDTQIYQPIKLDKILVVYSFYNLRDRDQIDECINILSTAQQMYNIKFNYYYLEITNFTLQSCLQQIEYEIKQRGLPDLILFPLKSHESNLKDVLKQKLTYNYKIQSQFFLRKRLLYRQKNYLKISGNICKQIAAKKNMQLWRTQPIKGYDKIILQIGISIKRVNKIFQCVVVVSSNVSNSKFSTYFKLADSKHIPDQQINRIFKNCIILFSKPKKQKIQPTTIFIYRMGINNQKSAEQWINNQIKLLKIKIKQASTQLFKKEFNPQIIYIKVIQRPSQKIWVSRQNNQNNSFLLNVGNPDVGTVKKGQDDSQFYLISYRTSQGCVHPSYFKIMTNQKNVDLDFIVQFTYNQCFMYFNYQGSVRIPAVLQYCNKLHKFVKPQQKILEFKFEKPLYL